MVDTFDFVVVSTGLFSVPFIPEYKGMNSFPGRIMHSHDFRDAEEFRNKNVIVLGSSYSAEDVALQCNKYGAKSVTIGYRNNACLLYTSPSPRDGLLSRMPSSA